MNYTCEKAVGPNKTCDFRTGKVILQQEIEPTQIRKLLSEGRTELLTGFISSRTRRKFKAYLKRGDDGKVGFEFETRKPKTGDDQAANGKNVFLRRMPRPRNRRQKNRLLRNQVVWSKNSNPADEILGNAAAQFPETDL